MPPVLRRPGGVRPRVLGAKAKAAPKAKAKAKAKGKAKAGPRPRRRGVRAPPAKEAEAVFDQAGFDRGVEFTVGSIPLATWKKGMKIIVTQGTYWEEPVKVAGTIVKLESDGDVRTLLLELKGTQCESLVKWKGSRPRQNLELDLCLPLCAKVSKEGLVHCEKIKLWVAEAEEPWMRILEEVGNPGEDELDALRERADRLDLSGKDKRREEARELKSSESSERSRRKKKKKKKKKSKKEATDGKKKVKATKSLEVLFEGTGLDPDPVRRKRDRKSVV